jgi:autotransporter-associated beta strand protein
MKKKVLGLILLVVGMSLAAQAVTSTWTIPIGTVHTGLWSTVFTTVPNGAGDVAILTGNLTANKVVTNDLSALSLGGLQIGKTTAGLTRGVTINGNAITFTNSAGGTYITKVSGGVSTTVQNDFINTALILGSNLAVTNNNTLGSLVLGGNISEVGVRSISFDSVAGSPGVILSGTNTYSGTTTISSGKLQIGNAGNSGTLGSGAVINNGALVFNRTNAQTVANDISGTGSVANNGDGNLTLTGANTATGDFGWTASGKGNITTASIGNGNGNIRIFQNEALHTTASITTTKGLVFGGGSQINQDIFVDSGTLTIGGLVTDATAVTTSLYRKQGVGTLVYTNDANTFGTRTQISEGGLSVTSIKNVGVASALGQPGTAAQGTLNIGGGTATGSLIYTGTGDTSDRILNLFGTSGGMTLDQSGAGLLKFTSDLTATSLGAKTLTLKGSTAGTGEIGGAIVDSSGGATALTKTGSGAWTLSGNNTFTGTTTVNGGTLSLNRAGGTLANTVAVNINNGATLDVAQDDTVGAVQVQANGGTISGAGTLTGSSFTANIGTGSDANISAKLAGATATFVKSGLGGASLSGANTFGGGTTASAGTLVLGHKDALGTGNLTLSGAQLQIAADLSGGVSNAITLGANSTIYFTNVAGVANSADFSGVIGNDGTARSLTLTTVNKGASVALRPTMTLSAANTYDRQERHRRCAVHDRGA